MPLVNHRTVRALGGSALAFLAACAEPPSYDLRRLSFDDRAPQILETGGVARSGMKLRSGEDTVARDLQHLSAGRVEVFVAPEKDAGYGGGVDVELRETGWRSWTGSALQERCARRWGEPGSPAGVPWQRCSFELPRPIGSARLEVRRRGSPQGDILVSDIRLEGIATSPRPNVFVLMLDAARFDGLRPFRAESGIGDHLEALAKDSVVLSGLHSSSSWTRPAVASLFTGMRAERHRVLDRPDVLPDDAVTLAEKLKEAGYSTAAWSTNPNVLPVWGLAQGFDVFVDQGSHTWGAGKTDGATVVSRLRAALADRGPEPLFFYAHLMDPHAPYIPSKLQRETVAALPGIQSAFPRPFAILTQQKHWSAFLDYTGELLDTDDHVGEFIALLKQENLYDNSMILVLSDHGEEFIDHGGRDHGLTLYEEVLHVPALIKLPGSRHAGEVMNDLRSIADLMPTVLAEAGVEAPEGIDGVPLDFESRKPEEGQRSHVATLRLDGKRQSTILDPPWKLVRYDSIGRLELYDLHKDPRERQNLYGKHADVAMRMKNALDLALAQGQEGWHVLFCGTLEEAELPVVVRTPGGKNSQFGFDDGEVAALEGDGGSWTLKPLLKPVSVERGVLGQMKMVQLPEVDEFGVIPAAGAAGATLEIRSEAGTPFDYRVGVDGKLATAPSLSLRWDQPGVAIPRGARVECAAAIAPGAKPSPAKRPFLRVWFVPAVPPTPKLASESLDPVTRERLRALGYLQ